MAWTRDEYYIVPMTLERALERLEEMAVLGIRLQATRVDADTYDYLVERLQPGRGGDIRVVDQSRGRVSRYEEELTRVDPEVRSVPAWKYALFYSLYFLFGLLLALLIAAITEGMFANFARRAIMVIVIYIFLFFLIQPQRLVFGSSGDAHLDEFVKGVLSGPYADPKNLYELHFRGEPYWQQHQVEIAKRKRPQP